jgi:hypothetical protein
MGTVPLVVVLNDVLYANEAFLIRLQLLGEVLELAVCSAPTASDLVVVITVCGNYVDHDFVCDHVLPVCTGGYAAIQHVLR